MVPAVCYLLAIGIDHSISLSFDMVDPFTFSDRGLHHRTCLQAYRGNTVTSLPDSEINLTGIFNPVPICCDQRIPQAQELMILYWT
jgi:hypothetical protein